MQAYLTGRELSDTPPRLFPRRLQWKIWMCHTNHLQYSARQSSFNHSMHSLQQRSTESLKSDTRQECKVKAAEALSRMSIKGGKFMDNLQRREVSTLNGIRVKEALSHPLKTLTSIAE